MVIVLVGPMGCGKTTVGRLLAQQLGWPFDDADDFHPPANIAKMRGGTPLTDEDRHGWLTLLSQRIAKRLQKGEHLILACSALKEQYRQILGVDQHRVVTVYLQGSHDLLAARITARQHQFMNDSLLASQLATMEPPTGGLHLSIESAPEDLTTAITLWLKTLAQEPTTTRPPQ